MTLQYRVQTHQNGEWSEWRDHTQAVWRANHQLARAWAHEIREKPNFEPGYYVDNSVPTGTRGRYEGMPREVRWFNEDPGKGSGWERVTIYNDHLD